MKTIYEHVQSIPIQKIFVIIKPGFLQHSQSIIERFKEVGWRVEKTKVKRLLLSEAKSLYKVHKEEDFYKPLCEYMSSDITRAIIFSKPGNQSKSTFDKVSKLKDEIRKEYSESDMRNVLHSSDSQEAMDYEMGIYF